MGEIRLYLLGYKGLKVISDIITHFGSDIIAQVVVGSDNNVLKDYSKEITDICIENEIPCCSRKEDNVYTKNFSIAIGWKWLIDLRRVPNLVIIHDSLLPKYRGFNPLVSALINGDRLIGATALFASSKYDEGDIIQQNRFEIKYPIKIIHAIELISKAYTSMTYKIINDIIAGRKLKRERQNSSKATYSLWRDDNDYFIDWNWEAKRIRRFVDAVGYPYDGAKCLLNDDIAKVYEVEEYTDVVIENRTPGKVLCFEDNKPIVVCGMGLLKIIDIKSPADEFIYIKSIRTRFK